MAQNATQLNDQVLYTVIEISTVSQSSQLNLRKIFYLPFFNNYIIQDNEYKKKHIKETIRKQITTKK